ncbi:RNA-directed DNA polymerase, eukaryota, partial [Tanacetum coccineum]
MKELQDLSSIEMSEVSQKAKVQWAMEGDENSKYFHGIFNKKISNLAIQQSKELESGVSYDEINKAVWECGLNKPPDFFDTSKFPRSCNSSFIALILKVQDAIVAKAFRPISLIESMYKIIAKVMASRLSFVIRNLISEDYLDDTLKSFGFDEKWRGWIDGCLKSAMGSILINGNPTSESKFQRVLGAGLFKGVSINGSLMLSYLFYADDVVFITEWSDCNIKTIVHVLKCFFLASGLKINLHKSNMGISVSPQDVTNAANVVGCMTFTTPFNYLGIKVGDIMSR